MLTVQMYDRNKVPVDTLATLQVERYAASAQGGPADCTITATGVDSAIEQLRARLGYYVVVLNGNGDPVWWGMLTSVVSDFDGISLGASLEDMANRVRVAYTVRDGEGYAAAALTGWVQSDRSVDYYGAKELVYTTGEASPAQADAMAGRVLLDKRIPKQSVRMGRASGATLRCTGLWDTLRWTYYQNTAGREVYDPVTNAQQAIGWGFTASDVGFADRRLHRVSGGLDAPERGDVIRVSGSSSNNGTHTVEESKEGNVTEYTATTIEFDPTDDILDSNNGLGFVREGTIIELDGSSYDGYHLVTGRGRDHITVDLAYSGPFSAVAAGPSITVTQGESLPLTEDVTSELPGASVTVSSYSKIAYQFSLTDDNDDWSVAEVWVKVRRQGSPGDSLKVELLSDVLGAPGSVLDSATITGTSLTETFAWVKFTFNSTADVAYGSNYWIAVSRTGANNATAYYVVALLEGDGYPGVLKLYDGSAWVDRATDGAMPFQVWGHVETSSQIDAILQSEGQFLEGRSVRAATGLYQRQYRDGTTDAQFNLEELIASGNDSNEVLFATISPDWRTVVDVAPDATNPPYMLRRGPKLVTSGGQPVAEGLLPVGQWCEIDGFQDPPVGLSAVSPFMIGYAEYDARKGTISAVQAHETKSIFDVGIAQG